MSFFSGRQLFTPIGCILPYGGSVAPSGFILCDGSAVSRTLYANLFSVIAILYGSGDGTTTFNIPDMRGRIAAGKDNMGGVAAGRLTSAGSGIDGATLGATGGAENVVLTISQMPAHTHTSATGSIAGGAVPTATSIVSGSITTSSTGGGAAHINAQPTMITNSIIKF